MSLQLSNVIKSFQQGENKVEVLKGLNAEVKQGEIVAILGKSGSGKSTLLSVLAGLTKVDQGQYSLNGHKLESLSEDEWSDFRSQNIAIVFQQYHLVSHLTALENVTLPLEIQGQSAEAQAKAKKILEDLGLGHRLDHFPKQLSGGESQRVAIARALIASPKLLLADEPSGNLDVTTGDSVMKLFFEVVRKNKITTLLVTHNEELARMCDRILRIQDGRFQEN